jgi:small-conductance mechanosensitive channel
MNYTLQITNDKYLQFRPAAAALLAFVFCSFAFSQTIPPVDLVEMRSSAVPREVRAIQAAIDDLRAEVQQLPAPTSQPAASQPATSQTTTQPGDDLIPQRDESVNQLRNALTELEKQLRELLRLTQELEPAAVDEAARKLTERITTWRNRIVELAQVGPPTSIDDKVLADLIAEHAKASQRLDTTVAARTQQETKLRDGFKKEREASKETLAAASNALLALEATISADLKAADSDLRREILTNKRRLAHARSAALDTAAVVLELREKSLRQDMERNRIRYEAMQPYVNALRARIDQLQSAKQQSNTEKLKKEIKELDATGTDQLQVLFKRLQLIRDENVPQVQSEFERIRERFGKNARAQLEVDLGSDLIYWKDLSETLSRLTAADVLDNYESAQLELESAEKQHRKIQAMIDKTFVEQRDLEERKRRELSRFDKTATIFRQKAATASDAESVAMIQKVVQLRAELQSAFDVKLDDVRKSLGEALGVTRKRVELWQAISRRLYWYKLITPAPSYFDTKVYQPIKEELNLLRGEQSLAALAQTRDSFLFQVQRLQRVDWGIIAAVELTALGLLLWLLRRSRSYLRATKPQGDTPDSQAVSFMDRLRPRTAKAALLFFPAIAIPVFSAVFIAASGIDQGPRRLGYVLCAIWAGIALWPTILYIAFHATKPRYRVVQCSSVVARHYVRLGYTLLSFGVLLVVPAVILWALDLASSTVDLLIQAFQFFTTLAVLVFLFRKDAVLNIVPRTQRGRLAGTVTALHTFYPLLVILLLALVLLRFTGFSAMATYVSAGLTSTLGALSLAWVVYLFFRETIVGLVRHTRTTRETYAASATTPPPAATTSAAHPILATASANLVTHAPTEAYRPTPEDEADDREPDLLPAPKAADELPGSARLALSACRWILSAAGLLLALYAWGLGPYEVKQILDIRLWEHAGQDITLWRIGGAALAIAVTMIVSRGIRQTLRSRFYPAHPGLDVGVQAAIDTLLHYIITLIGIYVALQTLRLDFGALAVLFGGLGLGLGLGLQPLIVNFTSGLIMLFERQVKVGDVINLGEKQGEVVRISMRSTIVRTADGLHIILPNGDFINQKVENWTLGHQPVRGGLDIVVSYQSDPERIRSILLEIARHERLAMRYPPAEVLFKDMSDSGMNFSIAAWYRNMAERGAGLLNMRYAIADRFAREGIEIPVKGLAVMKPGEKNPSGG